MKRAIIRAITFPVRVVIIAASLVDLVIRPLYRPVVSAVASLNLFSAFEAWIKTRSRLEILVFLATPFVIAEPLKFGALLIIAYGHIRMGAVLLVASHLITFILVERIYRSGRDKLLTYAWFAWLMRYVTIAHSVFEKMKATTLEWLVSLKSRYLD